MQGHEIEITPDILNLVAEIDEFKGRWESLGQLVPTRLNALKKIAAVKSVASAARLGGIQCSDRQVGEILSGKIGPANTLTEENRAFIEGYRLVHNLVYSSYDQISFIENHVLQMHKLLFKKFDKPDFTPGEYRLGEPRWTSENLISSATGADKVHDRINGLILWVNQVMNEHILHPLLVVALFNNHFYKIQPFTTGNLRMAQTITALLLLRSGYAYLPFNNLEYFFEISKNKYDNLLNNGETPPEEWIRFFLHVFKDHKESLTHKIEREKSLVSLPGNLWEIVQLVRERGRASISQIREATGANRNTLKIRLRKLVADNYLEMTGKGKGTRYKIGSVV